jgi:hypothetical protein
MAGISRIALLALLLGTIAVSTADAFGGRMSMFSSASRATTSYMAIPMTYYYHCWPAPTATVLPVPDAYPRYAAPTPAPPSPTKEPPIGGTDPRMPKIIARTPESAKERCRVGFWNLSGRDMSVTIEGKAWSLAKNQVLTFDMERQFTWQIAGKTPQMQRVPEGLASFEVLIRE